MRLVKFATMMPPRAALLTCLVCAAVQATAQAVLQPGTSLWVEEGTSLRLPPGLVWSIPQDAEVLNDGTIDLGPDAILNEAEGSAIQGNGTEVSRHLHAQALTAHQAGGLGLTLSTTIAPDSFTVVRGHAITDAGDGRSSVARWYTVATGSSEALGASIMFAYQDHELGTLDAVQLRIHRWEEEAWTGLPGASQPLERTVTATNVDAIGTITLFEANGNVGLAPTQARGSLALHPTVTDGLLHLAGDGLGSDSRITIMDQAGRTVQRMRPIPCGPWFCIDVSQLAQGAYLLRTDQHGAMPFFRQ